MRKKFLAITMVAAMTISCLYGCNSSEESSNEDVTKTTNSSSSTNNSTDTTSTGTKFEVTSSYSEEDEVTVAIKEEGKSASQSADVTVESKSSNTIYLDGSSISYAGEGVTIEGTTITITKGGTYVVTGTLSDGQIKVDSEDKETVWIILNNANITSKTNSPIYIVNAKKTILSLATGTSNTLSDAASYTYADTANEEPSACVFSKDDLVISGDGSLVVNGNFNNGIASKDTLTITNGNITVNAVNNGIKGKDYIVIKDGTFNVTAGGDAFKSDNTADTSLGYILIEGGKFVINSEEDGIQAETCLKITGGTFDIKTGDGAKTTSSNSDWGGSQTSTDTASIKGIKAGVDITITNGKFTINSEDDSLHTNGTMTISGGTFDIQSGDDGMHADTELTINAGTINITKSYEGIESSIININGGDISVVASDDGLNAAGGSDGSATTQRPGMNQFSSSTGTLNISGGTMYVNATGDGLDSNGDINMTGGTVYVDGPTSNGDGALDYDGTFIMTGGTVVAAGSNGMVQSVSNSSTQYCITSYFTSAQSANTKFTIKDSSGNEIISYTPSKAYQCVVVCSPEIKKGETYTVTGGSTTLGTATVSEILSTVGTATGGMGGGPGGMGGQGGGRQR